MSSIDSRPTDRRTRPGYTPVAACSASVSWLWVVEAGQNFVEALELHSHVANIGDVRSLAIHPASTTHSQLSEAELTRIGVEPGLVRLSVGLETIDDILADLELGFAAAKV